MDAHAAQSLMRVRPKIETKRRGEMLNKQRCHRALSVCAGLVALGAAVLAGPADATSSGIEDPNNWPEYHRTANGWRYSPLNQVNTATVQRLAVAWIHQPGDITHGLQATPITVDGVLYYIGANNRVFAVDAATGKELWKYVTDLNPMAQEIFFAAYNRGVTVGRGKVFIGTLDGRGIALDQKTGKELWSVRLTDFERCQGCNFTSPPTLAGDVLTFGPTGGELAQSAKLYGVHADTGKRLWAFDLLRDDPQSWPGDSRAVGGGGAWIPGQYDAETGLVYYGTSNAAPDFYGLARKGDNLYTASVIALDPKTGKLAWHRQEVPHDVWDYDSPYESLLLDDNGRPVLVHLNKGGYVSVMDRRDGSLINVWKLAKHVNWVQTVDPKSGELIGRNEPEMGKDKTFCPSVLGARSWNHGAYNPATRLWYTNAVEICNVIRPGRQDPKTLALAQPFFGMENLELVPPPGDRASARLEARDPLTGKIAWSIDYPAPALGSVLTTAGGLVFNGDSTGIVRAYDARTGKELWSFNTGSGIRAGITTYSVNGEQYVVVPSGFGSLFAGFASAVFPEYKKVNGGAALIAFKLMK
jgi:alcohol dehydrogenase (cytochrome c)